MTAHYSFSYRSRRRTVTLQVFRAEMIEISLSPRKRPFGQVACSHVRVARGPSCSKLVACALPRGASKSVPALLTESHTVSASHTASLQAHSPPLNSPSAGPVQGCGRPARSAGRRVGEGSGVSGGEGPGAYHKALLPDLRQPPFQPKLRQEQRSLPQRYYRGPVIRLERCKAALTVERRRPVLKDIS